jgi:hypothetical protein
VFFQLVGEPRDGKKIFDGGKIVCILGFGWGVNAAGGRNEERFFSGEVLLSNRFTEWLVSTMKELMGFLGGLDFVKSCREGRRH